MLRLPPTLLLSASFMLACGDDGGGPADGTGSGSASAGDDTESVDDTGTTGDDGLPEDPAEPDFAPCGGGIFDGSGQLVPEEYVRQARLWSREVIDCRLGPDFEALHPGEADDRPTAWEPPHQSNHPSQNSEHMRGPVG